VYIYFAYRICKSFRSPPLCKKMGGCPYLPHEGSRRRKNACKSEFLFYCFRNELFLSSYANTFRFAGMVVGIFYFRNVFMNSQ
jgi:hypothetical protein